MQTQLITFVSFLAIPKIAVGSADRVANQNVELTTFGVEFRPTPGTVALVPWSFIKSIVYAEVQETTAPKAPAK